MIKPMLVGVAALAGARHRRASGPELPAPSHHPSLPVDDDLMMGSMGHDHSSSGHDHGHASVGADRREDRKSVVEGKSGSERGDLGGRGTIKKKKKRRI